jgi:hypothetical protein
VQGKTNTLRRWLISSRGFPGRFDRNESHGRFHVQYDGDLIKKMGDGQVGIGIDGFVLPRESCYEEYRRLRGEELVRRLYEEKGLKFIEHIKGIFSILLVEADKFFVFNDRHCIRKFFIYRRNGDFMVASDLSIVAAEIDLEVDPDRAAIFSLMSRPIGGMTLFRHVDFSGPATFVRGDASLEISAYWLPDELLKRREEDVSFHDLAMFWKRNIQHYIEYLQPAVVTMTLTGGKDSRMILAALLSLGIRPNTFTFGDPGSLDAVVARKVAVNQSLNYNNHFVASPSPDWFATQGKRITAMGGSLLNIHRAHRLDAIEREMENNPANEMIFVGDMGGEYIHGFSYNDYILSKLYRLWKPGEKAANITLIRAILDERHFKAGTADLENIWRMIENQPFMRHKGKQGNFHVEFYIDDALHHTQDMCLYLQKIKYLACPFMDIDFMEALFSSPYHMPLDDGEPGKNHVLEMWLPDLRLAITHALAPELSGIAYGKRGHYTAREFLGSKLILMLKRAWRYLFDRIGIPTFAYGRWMAEFVARGIDEMSPLTSRLFDRDGLRAALARGGHGATESYWHDFSASINVDSFVKEYMENK